MFEHSKSLSFTDLIGLIMQNIHRDPKKKNHIFLTLIILFSKSLTSQDILKPKGIFWFKRHCEDAKYQN